MIQIDAAVKVLILKAVRYAALMHFVSTIRDCIGTVSYSVISCAVPCTHFPQAASCSESLSSTSALANYDQFEAPDPNNRFSSENKCFRFCG